MRTNHDRTFVRFCQFSQAKTSLKQQVSRIVYLSPCTCCGSLMVYSAKMRSSSDHIIIYIFGHHQASCPYSWDTYINQGNSINCFLNPNWTDSGFRREQSTSGLAKHNRPGCVLNVNGNSWLYHQLTTEKKPWSILHMHPRNWNCYQILFCDQIPTRTPLVPPPPFFFSWNHNLIRKPLVSRGVVPTSPCNKPRVVSAPMVAMGVSTIGW